MLRTLSAFAIALFVSAPAVAQSTNIETAGNLAATRDLVCLAPNDFKPDYTPADLAPAVSDCIANGRMDDGLFLFGTMLLYAYHDGQRITDRSAAQGRNVLAMRVGEVAKNGNPARYEEWKKALASAQKVGSPLTPDQCALHRRLGPPTYRPDYMIAHGIQALTKPDAEPMKADFDADTAWTKALALFIGCKS